MCAGSMDVEDTKAAILKAEQAVMLMDSRLQHKLRPEHKRALANAILRSGAQDDLVFHHQTVRKTPGWWTLGGLLARFRLVWETKVRGRSVPDVAERLDDWSAHIRRSGARRLLIAALIGLMCGLINLGLPAELALQALRDKTRPISASGDIIVVAKDEISRKAFGELPWSRKYDAMLLDRLREMGAKRIVFNEAFDREMDSAGDDQFIKALDRARGKVWLGAYYDVDQRSGRQIDFFPHPKFQMDCCVAHSYLWKNSFGYADRVTTYEMIGGFRRPSSALVLAGKLEADKEKKSSYIDTAIQYETIPQISAFSILNGQIDANKIRGRSIIIAHTVYNLSDKASLLGQYQMPPVFARVIAAESIKNGSIVRAGWIPALLIAVAVCLACVTSQNVSVRTKIVIAGAAFLMLAALVCDRFGLRIELAPALLALAVFGVRDRVKRLQLTAEIADPVSGLPSLSAFSFVRDRHKFYVGALKVERFSMHLAGYEAKSQREFVRAVASRINIVFPESVIHQGEDGIFVWLIDANDDYQPTSYIAQLTALFRIPIGGSRGPHDVGIAAGFSSDMSADFNARLAVAVDRARVSLFGTLSSVQ